LSKSKLGSLRNHSLGIASVFIFTAWIVLYALSDPSKHLGSFFGNAIADWLGVVVMIFATKHLYEKGSAESREPPKGVYGPIIALREHSLSVFLLLTGIAWVILFVHMLCWSPITQSVALLIGAPEGSRGKVCAKLKVI
jgi:hypothetical protein